MPIYEYQCSACGHRMEAFQKISEASLKTCPACNKNQLQKQVSAAGFQLKGGGWYVTDYSGKGKSKKDAQNNEGKSSDSKTKTDSTSSTDKTDTK